ncbi:MAG: DUF4386 domain-containing protein [Chloroflexi bacterium]|nr:DUF4386 domain-containing protein [Chloroflexota bacterium]
MNGTKKIARIVGVLYVIGTVAGILSVVFTGPILGDPDYLVNISANANQVITGVLFVLIMGLALAMVPVMMFPILKKHNEALALGYVVFRGGLETVTYIVGVISSLLLLTLSQVHVQAGVLDASNFQALGTLLLETEVIISSITTIVFILGALMFYYVLYQSRLIPRWISGWGLIAAIPYFVAGFLVMFGLIDHMSTVDAVLRLPLGLQEMVLALWLIVKGFNPSAIAPGSARQI